MTDKGGIARRDLELLSAFLDGELSASEEEQLKARLETDEDLHLSLEALRATTAALGNLPEVRPPRSFALTQEMVQPRRAYPFLQLGTAVAALSFVLVVGADLLLSSARGGATVAPTESLLAADQIEQEPLAEPEAAQAIAGEAEAPSAAPAEDQVAAGPVAEELPPASAEDAAEESERALAGAAEPETEMPGDAADGELFKSEPESAEGQVAESDLDRDADLQAGEGLLAPGAEPAAAPDEMDLDRDEAPPINLLRIIEISLAAILIVLIALTLWVRKRT